MNKVLLIGRLGSDPAIRNMPSGELVCNFNIATQNGSHTEWHKIVCYKRIAEYSNKTLHMGDFVFVEAEIRTREFQTEEDKIHGRKPRKVLELVANEVSLVEKHVTYEKTIHEPLAEVSPIETPEEKKDSKKSPTFPKFA